MAASVQVPVAKAVVQAVPQTVVQTFGGSRPAGMPPLPAEAVVPVAALTGTTPAAATGTVPRMVGRGGPSYNPATAAGTLNQVCIAEIIEPDFPKARIHRAQQPKWKITDSGLELTDMMSKDFESTFEISG